MTNDSTTNRRFHFAFFLMGTLALFLGRLHSVEAQTVELQWQTPPLNNPLRGLVPYEDSMPTPKRNDPKSAADFEIALAEVFPHSIEFFYMPMSKIMVGENQYDWSPIEEALNRIQTRHCQSTFRIYLEYPGQPNAIPQFLIDDGLKVVKWRAHGGKIHTPDYENPKLRSALVRFIAEFGKRYDGDPRIAWPTVGMLGLWGEWHNYPKPKLFASKETQRAVLEAWRKAFKITKSHLRYPASAEDSEYAANDQLPFGYHDDSFAFATIPTGKSDDEWFYGALLEAAGSEALSKWKTQPIGGEIRPEVWGCVFESPSCAPDGQEFLPCVEFSHATWLMDSGTFGGKATPQQLLAAKKQTARLGYQLTITKAQVVPQQPTPSVEVTMANKGVAPFYYDWPVETVILDDKNRPRQKLTNAIRLTEAMPGAPTKWTIQLRENTDLANMRIGVRVKNPMENGYPLRFANKEQRSDETHWLVIDFGK